MSVFKKALLIAGVTVSQLVAAPDPNFHVYLLFGQSNMAGGAAGQYDGEGTKGVDDYCDTTPRVQVLAFTDCNRSPYPCPNRTLNRTHDKWYTAFPPYHNCHEGIGPADGFGKTLLDSMREDISIGFVPCALSGQKLVVYKKGANAPIDAHTQPTIDGGQKLQSGAYEWMIKRAKLAQQKGVIKGILFHQGEADNNDQTWPGRVKAIVDDIKKDLGLWDSIPFIAGEMRYDGCCAAHNPLVNKLPDLIPNCKVASANGIERRLSRPDGQVDQYHFSTKGTKEFGLRYAKAFLSLVNKDYLPRKGQVNTINNRVLTHQAIKSAKTDITLYSLNGRTIRSYSAQGAQNALRDLNANGVYIISRKLSDGRTATVPVIRQ